MRGHTISSDPWQISFWLKLISGPSPNSSLSCIGSGSPGLSSESRCTSGGSTSGIGSSSATSGGTSTSQLSGAGGAGSRCGVTSPLTRFWFFLVKPRHCRINSIGMSTLFCCKKKRLQCKKCYTPHLEISGAVSSQMSSKAKNKSNLLKKIEERNVSISNAKRRWSFLKEQTCRCIHAHTKV